MINIEIIVPSFRYNFTCIDANGNIKWNAVIDNLVTTVGKNDLLTQYFKGSAYTATWYIGLIDNASYTSGPAAGDTSASHGGWIENTVYSNATRPSLTFGTAAGGSLATSSASTFNINGGPNTLKGGFIISNSTKGGSTGILYSAATFSGGDRIVSNGDTLNVSVTLGAA